MSKKVDLRDYLPANDRKPNGPKKSTVEEIKKKLASDAPDLSTYGYRRR